MANIERTRFAHEINPHYSMYGGEPYEWKVYVKVRLRRVSDGREIEVDDSVPHPADHEGDVSGPRFMWSAGNYACDCNRHLFFQRALGEMPDDDVVCSHDRYEVVAPAWIVEAIEAERRNQQAQQEFLAKHKPGRASVKDIDEETGTVTMSMERIPDNG